MLLLPLLALIGPQPGIAAADDVVEYYHLDALGNVRVITDEDGDVVERHDYYPFGDVPWLQLDSTSDVGPSTVTVTADPTGLADGIYVGRITVTASDATGSPSRRGHIHRIERP
jgi:hypothetical protein